MKGLYTTGRNVVGKVAEGAILTGAGVIDGVASGVEKTWPTIKDGPTARFISKLGKALGDEKPAAAPAEKK